MKRILYSFILFAFILASCVNEDEWNQARESATVPPAIEITAVNAEGVAVSGAAFKLYATQADYTGDVNAILESTTDANGVVYVYPEDVDSVRGRYYFRITSGELKNTPTITPYVYWTNGVTKIKATLK